MNTSSEVGKLTWFSCCYVIHIVLHFPSMPKIFMNMHTQLMKWYNARSQVSRFKKHSKMVYDMASIFPQDWGNDRDWTFYSHTKFIVKSNQNIRKWMKINVWRGPKSKKIDVWGRLGASWGVLERCGLILEGFFRDIEAKMGATWAELEPSKQQVGPKMSHVSVKMAMLRSFWETLTDFRKHFWCILSLALDIKEPWKT